MEWKLIETAPKDGSKFIGLMPDGLVYITHRQAYNIFGEQKEGGGCDVVGKRWGWSYEQSDAHVPCSPTHWMPLPEGPKE